MKQPSQQRAVVVQQAIRERNSVKHPSTELLEPQLVSS
jgi:hypothetical protein